MRLTLRNNDRFRQIKRVSRYLVERVKHDQTPTL